MSARKLISIIGTGRLGSAVALQVAGRELGDLRLIDIIKGLPQGEALDLGQMAAEQGADVDILGSNDYKDIAGSDLVVVIGGLARKPGMTRLDLQDKNEEIIRGICEKIVEYAPKSLVLMVTNPLDIMTYLAWRVTGFEPSRVFGQSRMLDTMRFKYFIAKALGVSTSSIQAVAVVDARFQLGLLDMLSNPIFLAIERQTERGLTGQKRRELDRHCRSTDASQNGC